MILFPVEREVCAAKFIMANAIADPNQAGTETVRLKAIYEPIVHINYWLA
ncbi:hypothetical protein [Pedobacter sp.]